MSSYRADLSLPADFDNIVRLFPLPSVVLFPGVVQALHIFEPRYRAMTEDALNSDSLITMSLILPELQNQGADVPELAPTVCVGKILSHTELPDGRFNLFLVGARRARVIRELNTDAPYREAEIEVLADIPPQPVNATILRQQLNHEFRKLASLQEAWNHEALDQFLDDELPLGQMIDMIGYACGADPSDQQRVLDAVSVSQRGEVVLELVRDIILSKSNEDGGGRTFPPDFSLN